MNPFKYNKLINFIQRNKLQDKNILHLFFGLTDDDKELLYQLFRKYYEPEEYLNEKNKEKENEKDNIQDQTSKNYFYISRKNKN